MGLADRDYMRRDDRPPPTGGIIGAIVFILVLLALVLVGMPRGSKFYRKHIAKPFHHMMKNLGGGKPYHKRKHGR